MRRRAGCFPKPGRIWRAKKKLLEEHRRGVRQAAKALGISVRERERIEGDISRLEVRLKDSADAAVKAAGEAKVKIF